MRIRVRGVFIDNNCLLTIHRQKEGKEYWVFPGGGVEEGEDQETALRRELREELGVEVEIQGQFAIHQSAQYQEIFYRCKITGGELGSGQGPELQEGTSYVGTYSIEWIPMADVQHKNILPEEIKTQVLMEEQK